MRRGATSSGVLVLVLLLGSVASSGPAPAPKGERASIATADGLALTATWWAAGDAKGPAVVLLPGEGDDRGSLLSVVPHLLERRLAVMTLDLRGQGESAKQKTDDLAAAAKSGDEALLAATWQDVVAAAKWVAKSKGRDPTRIGALAVGRATLVALDAAGRQPGLLRAVVGLTPIAKAPGLDGEALGKLVPAATAVLLVSHREDDAGAVGSLGGSLRTARTEPSSAALVTRILETPRPEDGPADPGWFRGVRMLNRVPLTDAYVSGFLARELGVAPNEALLDGDVGEESDAAKGGPWTKATKIPTEQGSAFAYRADSRVVFGGTMPKGHPFLELRLRANGPGVDWAKLAQGIIDLRMNGRYATASANIEAPEGHVRLATASWHDDPEDEEGEKPASPGAGAPPDVPDMPPGMPEMPDMPGGGLDTPFEVVFRPQGEAFTFEGQIELPILKGAKKPKVEMAVGWSDRMPGMPTHIPLGPIGPMDLGGPWTEIPLR